MRVKAVTNGPPLALTYFNDMDTLTPYKGASIASTKHSV